MQAAAAAALLGTTLAAFDAEYCARDEGERVTKFREGACIFLDGNRCRIYEARPRQCRTWPFWPENLVKRAWDRDVAPFCAGVGKGRLHDRAEIEAIAAAADPPEDDENPSGPPET